MVPLYINCLCQCLIKNLRQNPKKLCNMGNLPGESSNQELLLWIAVVFFSINLAAHNSAVS